MFESKGTSSHTFACPFCNQTVSTHNRAKHFQTCDSADDARTIRPEHRLKSTIDAEWRRATGQE